MEDRGSRQPFDRQVHHILREVIVPDPEELGSGAEGRGGEPRVEDIRFDLIPRQLIDYLKNYIVGQDRALEIVATKICTHFHRMKLEAEHPELPRIVGYVKPNILLIGPTGVGKTYLIKLIAHKLRVPFVKGDATKFSETGYVGGDVEDLVRELVHQAGGNIKLGEYGIIYIDEIDKIASSGNWWGPDVSRSGVQRNLLKLMEETEVDMKVPHDLASQMEAVLEAQRAGRVVRKKVNTRNILFVVSGAFTGLPDIIARRLKKGGMGFSQGEMPTRREMRNLLEFVHAQDLVEYGFESEFVGRLPVITYFDELDEEALYGILKNPNSDLILSKTRDFASYGIKLTFDDQVFRLIAQEAYKKGIGARGLVGVVERVLLPFERTLPGTGIKTLHITSEAFHDPEGYLRAMLPNALIDQFAESFLEQSGIRLIFPPETRSMLMDKVQGNGDKLPQYLQETFKDYEYGLKLVNKDELTVPPQLFDDPSEFLNRIIKETYKHKARGKGSSPRKAETPEESTS